MDKSEQEWIQRDKAASNRAAIFVSSLKLAGLKAKASRNAQGIEVEIVRMSCQGTVKSYRLFPY